MSSRDNRAGEVDRLGPAMSPEQGSASSIQQKLTRTVTPGARLGVTPSISQNCLSLPDGRDAHCKLAWGSGKRVDSSGQGESVDMLVQCERAETCARIDQSDDLTVCWDPKSWSDAVHLPCLSANNNSNNSPKHGSLPLSRQSLGERGISANQQEPTGTQDFESRQQVIEDRDVLNGDVQAPNDQQDVSEHPSSVEQSNVAYQPSPDRSNTRYGQTSRRAVPPGQGLLSQRPDSIQRRTTRMKPEPSNQQPSPTLSQPSSPNKAVVGSPGATSEHSKWRSPTKTTNPSNWEATLKESNTQSDRWPSKRPVELSQAPSSKKLDNNKLSAVSSSQQPWNERADKRNEKPTPGRTETDLSRIIDKQNQLSARAKVDKKSFQLAGPGTDSPRKVKTSVSYQPTKKKSDSSNYQPSTENSGLADYQRPKESNVISRSQPSKEKRRLLDRDLVTEKNRVSLEKEGFDESHLQLTSGGLHTSDLSNPQSSLTKSPCLELPDLSIEDKLHTSSPSPSLEERIISQTKQKSTEDTTKIRALEGNQKSPTQKLLKAKEETSSPNTHTGSKTQDEDFKGKEGLPVNEQYLSKRAGISNWHSSSKQYPSHVRPDSTEEKSNTSVSNDQTEGTRQQLAAESAIPLGQLETKRVSQPQLEDTKPDLHTMTPSETKSVSQPQLEDTKPALHTMTPTENVLSKIKKIPVDEKAKNSDSAHGNNFENMLSKSSTRPPVSDKTPAFSSKKAFGVAVIFPGNASTSVDTAQREPYRKTSKFVSMNGRYEVVQSSSVDSDDFCPGTSTQETQAKNVQLRENYVVVTDYLTGAGGQKNQPDIPSLPDGHKIQVSEPLLPDCQKNQSGITSLPDSWKSPSEMRSLPDPLNERRVPEGQLEGSHISVSDDLPQSFDHVGDWLDRSLDVSASETPMTLQKKESGNELTECDISHSEILADVENSEAAEPQFEKMPILLVETSQASSFHSRNEISSVPAVSMESLDFSAFTGIEPTREISRPSTRNGRMADGLRHRQPHLANLSPDMDYEVAAQSEHARSFRGGGERTDAAVDDLINVDPPRARNEALRLGILFDIPPAGLGVMDNSATNRILLLNSPYNISFNLMLSMLVITVVLLLNHLRELLLFRY